MGGWEGVCTLSRERVKPGGRRVSAGQMVRIAVLPAAPGLWPQADGPESLERQVSGDLLCDPATCFSVRSYTHFTRWYSQST